MNAQLALKTTTTANVTAARRATVSHKPTTLQVVRRHKPAVARKYAPLETDGPATCLVWFD